MAPKLSPQEREHELNKAARAYVQGKISAKEYEHVVRSYSPDYIAAARVLAQRRMSRSRGRKNALRSAVA